MKKILLLATLFSCQKELTKADRSTIALDVTQKISNGITQVYDQRIFNSCTLEYVHFTGLAQYNYFERGGVLVYEINFKGVTGIGETSGTIYHGGGATIGESTQTVLGGEGNYTYNVRFVAPGGVVITSTQLNHVTTDANGITHVEISVISDTCGL